MNFNENPRRFLVSTRGPGTKSRGAGTHQGGTREAPRRHQVTNYVSPWGYFAVIVASLCALWDHFGITLGI